MTIDKEDVKCANKKCIYNKNKYCTVAIEIIDGCCATCEEEE